MFDFNEPEDGAAERFRERLSNQKDRKYKYYFWWLVHNLISHPMIGLLPIDTCFTFHDWTSRKLNNDNSTVN